MYWSMVTTYPEDTVSGRGLRSFAERVETETEGYIAPHIQYRMSKRTAQLVDDVRAGRVDAADIFGGNLGRLDPLFELSTLPFLAQSEADAKTLACIAEPAYRSALAKAGLHLLVVSPWPPTGLWSRTPLRSASDIAHLKVRTYDEASATALGNVGAQASSLPMEQVKPLVSEGGIDAVLSSGDGSVGDTLAGILPNFAAVRYAFPVSFLVMSESRFKALSTQRQQQLTAAAHDVQTAEWQAILQRIAINYTHMRNNGVAIEDPISTDLRAKLQNEGRARAREWLGRAGSAGQAIFDAYNSRLTAPAGSECRSGAVEALDGGLG
ncbi:TRAP-type C4-dicarboxylate transport system substrate-binding protein [Paraburkholderia sp. BL23I1N1]|uniref:TRAP transporter substrate-binding protein DctP n=1 Tax=Paraburkholderia sp. BL23I1N1 TaxID=1938802 RepID=UPI000FEE82EC|nr:TRAP transporter substrate-binding protein DctP [Paraburkholderia sp. BL23I1N1]RKE23890.1 TRAP-type C4-dicarboxylate transport system substrate-binding protein [Paraburkholderia sp. BL23I1N1]